MSKLAVVTGATGGLGSVLVTTLLTAGYDLIACGRNEARLTALTQWHTAPSRFVMPWVCDLATATPEALADDLQRLTPVAYARVSLLVCAHGAPPCLTPTLDLTVNEVERIYRTDVLGTLLMAQVVGAGMVERREGAMVFVSSAHATQTYPARAPYAMAKASVCSLARALAVEWGHANVRVNSVSPWQCAGPTRSTAVAAQEEAQTGQSTEQLYRQRAPLERLVRPEDVATTVLWLAENRSMTGQDIRVDCGQSASMWHRGFGEPHM